MTPATPSPVLDELHDQIDAVSKRVETYLREAGDDAQDAGSRVAFKVMEASRALSHEARLRSRRLLKDATASVKEHPWAASAALAAAVAALAGAISLASRREPIDAAE